MLTFGGEWVNQSDRVKKNTFFFEFLSNAGIKLRSITNVMSVKFEPSRRNATNINCMYRRHKTQIKIFL